MPEMDGVEATAEIRKLPHGKNIPIIACTAHAIESDTKVSGFLLSQRGSSSVFLFLTLTLVFVNKSSVSNMV